MPSINIKKFGGVNKKSDPRDFNNHGAQTLDSFETFRVADALVKRRGYTDQASVILPASYPSSWTIKNFFQFRVNKPSTKEIFIVHATVGGVDRIYVDWTYSGSWSQGWVELTEKEESMTVDSSVDTTHFVDTGLASSADDYYNGWFVINWKRLLGSLVDDYVGSSNTITLHTAIASMAATDEYSIYRFPLVTQVEGTYTADTGSSTTQTYDIDDTANTEYYEVQSDFDDAYNDWSLRSGGNDGMITDFKAYYANHQRYITHGSVAAHAKATVYYLLKKTFAIQVDDKIQFYQRGNTCIMMLGNASGRYPKQFPLWYGYIRDTYYYGQSGNNISAGYYLEPAPLIPPKDGVISDTTDTTDGSDPLTAGESYYFATAFTYDGYQIGELTSLNKAVTKAQTSLAASKKIQVALNLGYCKDWSAVYSLSINKRITAINIFVSTDLNATTKEATWYLIHSIPIREDYNIDYGGVIKHPPTIAYERRPFSHRVGLSERDSMTPSGRVTRTKRGKETKIGWGGTDPYTLVVDIQGTDWTNKGEYYTLHSGGMGGDRINYEVGAGNVNHSIVGRLYGEDVEESVAAYSPLKSDGTPSQDWFPTLNVMDMARHGIYSLTNIKLIDDTVFFVGASKTVKMLMSSGLVPAFKVIKEFDYIGSDAVNGILAKDSGVFVVGKKGIHFLDQYEHYLSLPIEDVDSYPLGVTTLSEAYIAYHGELNELWVVFPTDSKLYTYNLYNKQWAIHSLADGIKALVTGKDGEVYGADGSKIYKMNNGTTDDGTAINPQRKSKVYSASKANKELILNDIEVVYKSDTVWQFDIYLNRGSAASWNASTDNQFATATSLISVRKQFPTSFRGNEIEFGISIPSVNRASNTYLEIHEINIDFDEEDRID